MDNKKLSDYIDIDFLQEFQDAFAGATGMASICSDLEGPVTRPSNFTQFCNVLTRGTKVGFQRCTQCDIDGGAISQRTQKPAVYRCHAGLMDFGAPIVINGELVGSILGGQVLTAPPDEEKFRSIAVEIGVDPDEYISALRKVRIVPEQQIHQAANLLYLSMKEIGRTQTQYLKLERSHLVIQEQVNYVDDQVKVFSNAVEILSTEQNDLLRRLHSLKTVLDNLNKIVGAVTRISKSTTLLSFNASIEAARAGSEGKGFIVLAQEMRNLSTETTSTLERIKSYTQEVMDANREVMEISSTSVDALKSQLDRLHSVSPRLQSIVDEISDLK